MVIKKLRIMLACGEDKIHNLMLKNSTQDFRKIILNLINSSVTHSKIPQKWKNSLISKVRALQKSFDHFFLSFF